jgi:hypothetical protein
MRMASRVARLPFSILWFAAAVPIGLSRQIRLTKFDTPHNRLAYRNGAINRAMGTLRRA